MAEFMIANMAPIMFASMIVFLLVLRLLEARDFLRIMLLLRVKDVLS